MNKHYYFLTVLFTALIGVFTNLHAQEPAELGYYRISKIGTAQNTFKEGQWYLLGRNPYLVRNGETDGYVYDSNTAPVDMTARVANAACSGNTDHGTVSGWTRSGSSNNFEINLHSGSLDGVGDMPYAEVWVGGTTLSNATIRQTTNLTSLTEGYYRLTVKARIYCEDHVSPRNSNPTGVSFVAIGSETVSVDLSTGTLSADGYGYYGTYSLIVRVGENGTLNFGFNIANATCNWLAFKNVTLSYLGNPYEDKTSEVANYQPNSGSAGAAGSSTTRYVLTNTLTAGGEYLIVSRNSEGDGYALGYTTRNNNATVARDAVNVNAADAYSAAYINPADVDATSVWTVANSFTFQNGYFYIHCNNNNLTIDRTYTNWNWNNNRLSYTNGSRTYYIRYSNRAWSVSTNTSNIYIYKKETVNIPSTPGSLDNWNTTEYNLTLQTSNARYDLGDTWTGNAGDLYNDGSVFDNEVTVSHDLIEDLPNGQYQISVEARIEGTEVADVQGHPVTTGPFYYGYQSIVGRSYENVKLTVDTEAILASIDAASISDVTVYAENIIGDAESRTTDILNGGIGADGWRNGDGTFQGWGDNARFCVKFNPALDSEQVYYLGGMPGTTANPAFYKAKYVYVNNSDTSKEAVVYITLGYYEEIFSYSVESTVGNYYENKSCSVETSTILATLGAGSIGDVTVYAMDADGTRWTNLLDADQPTEYYDGYRDGNGTFATWGSTAPFYVKYNPTLADNQAYQIGGHVGRGNFPASYTARYIYAYNGKEAAVNITLTYTNAHARFYANDYSIELNTGDASTGSDDGYRGTYVLNTVVTDGKLDFGFKIPGGSAKWLSFKNVELLYLGGQGLKMSNNEKPTVGNNAGANDVKKYLVRFTHVADGAQGSYWTIQMGTGNYAEAPIANAVTARASGNAGHFFVYPGEGYRDETWTVTDGVFLKSTTSGATYNYYLQGTGLNAMVQSYTNPNSVTERWGVDINGDAVFALYPLTLTETNPNVPTFPSLDYAGKFYKIKNRETGNYATYSTYTSSLYPELLMEKTGGYAMVTRTAENLNGASYWWFSDASEEASGEQQFAAQGTKAVRIHNVMMHDMDYTRDPQGKPTPHTNETLYSTLLGVTSGGQLYYLLPAAEDGGTEYWALSRTEYSSNADSWFTNDWALPIIGQTGAMNEEHPYNMGNRSQWVLEEAQPSEVWEKVKASKRRELHEGAYFSPTTKTLDPIFAKYVATPSSQSELLTTVENLGREIYAACTDASLPTLAPEEGGRFYFRAYAADNHYFAENNGLTLENGREPNTVWEIIPFSDPTPIVRVDDQPLYNEFSSAYYETLLHRPLQRFWLRNRATGKFLTHAPFDKSGYTKINEGVWNMNTGGVPAFGNWQGYKKELGTMGSLEREGADLWYFDVVSNPRTGLRTGVLRTLFCYDYGPWQGTSWDGTLDERGMPINDVDGDAIAGYNYPVVQLDPNEATVTGGGVTATDHLRAYSQWVIYNIDTDLPEVGVNYTLKNKYSGKYAYWDEGMKLTESVENLATAEDELNNNRGVWTLFDLTGKKYRIANRWAIQKNETNQNLLSGSPFSLSSTGSTFVLPTSNVDEKGIAIGTNTDLDFTKQSWMNGNVGVTTGASEDDKAVWSIDKVDRQYDDVVYDLNKMLGNLESGDDFFYVDKDAVSSYNARITEWNSFVENTTSGALTDTQKNTEYPTYKTIKDLTNGKIGDNNFVMPVKKDGSGTRYLIRNKETGRYLSLNGQLMTVDSTDVDFYAVWDLSFEETESGTKYLYTLINEGAKFEMDAQSGDRKADYHKLMWNKDGGDYAFEMAKATSTAQATKLHFRPDGEGHARLHWYKAGDTDLDDDPVLYGPTWGDRTVQSKTIKINNAYWEIIPFTDFFTTERSADHQKSETALLQHAFTQLEGFSGGPISMTDVNSSVVGKGTGSYDLKNLPNRVANVNTVEKMRLAMVDMWKMDEKFLLQWKPGFPLFLDNMFRPTSGARLTTGSDGVAWTTTKTKDETLAEQTFEFETAGSGVYLKNKGGNYIKTSSADDADVEATTETSNAAQLTLKEVRPGVYSMKDSQGRYLSINEDSIVVWGKRCGYGSLWRIKCNDYIPVTANQVKAESELWPGKYVKTFYSDYDTRIEHTDGLTPYFAKNDAASAGERELTDGSKEQQVKIHFTPVTAGTDSYYYMEGGQSYILVKDTQMDKTEIKIWSQYKGGDESIAGKNILSIQKDQIDITADNQRTLFALNYITPGTAIGTIGGQTVTSFGLGFYPLKQGGRIPSYVPFISAETIGDAIRALRENIKNAGSEVKGEVFAPSMQIVLEDEDGNVTDAIDIPIGNVDLCDGPVFDLSGCKVAEHLSNVSRKGVYIVNGQKVLRK